MDERIDDMSSTDSCDLFCLTAKLPTSIVSLIQLVWLYHISRALLVLFNPGVGNVRNGGCSTAFFISQTSHQSAYDGFHPVFSWLLYSIIYCNGICDVGTL